MDPESSISMLTCTNLGLVEIIRFKTVIDVLKPIMCNRQLLIKLDGTFIKNVTVKWGKSEHLKNFKVILKLFCDGFLPVFLQKSWYQKFYFLFQDLKDRF